MRCGSLILTLFGRFQKLGPKIGYISDFSIFQSGIMMDENGLERSKIPKISDFRRFFFMTIVNSVPRGYDWLKIATMST